MRRLALAILVAATVLLNGGDAAAQDYSGGYESAIYEACAYYGCSAEWLISVMYCESWGDPSAIGPNGERGLFQYHPAGLWPEMAYAGPYEQIWHAAWAFSAGYSSHWVCA